MIFFCLIIILSILEEISFFKKYRNKFFLSYFLTFLSSPITLFEVFPFIFLLSTQFLFYGLFRNEELNLLKINGLSNLKIIYTFLSAFSIGLITVLIFYNAASKLKFVYTDLKNSFSEDNKYLAVVNDSGLWLKDEINNTTLIVKANFIEDNYLSNVIINEFDDQFDLIRTIQSEKVDISNKNWILQKPKISNNNISNQISENFILESNFDREKINSLFSNISTLNILELFTLKADYENLGYSSDEIVIHLLRLSSTPLLYGILTVLSAVIMFNFRR